VKVFDPCLGVLAGHQVYVAITDRKLIDEGEKDGVYAPILLNTKTRRLLSASHLRTSSSYTSRPWHPATRIEHEENDVGTSTTLCTMRTYYLTVFLHLVGSCRRRVGRDSRDGVSRCRLCELG
jgi:hypothetical protein